MSHVYIYVHINYIDAYTYTVCVPGNNERRIFGRNMLGQSHINMSIGFNYNSFQDTQTVGGTDFKLQNQGFTSMFCMWQVLSQIVNLDH